MMERVTLFLIPIIKWKSRSSSRSNSGTIVLFQLGYFLCPTHRTCVLTHSLTFCQSAPSALFIAWSFWLGSWPCLARSTQTLSVSAAWTA